MLCRKSLSWVCEVEERDFKGSGKRVPHIVRSAAEDRAKFFDRIGWGTKDYRR